MTQSCETTILHKLTYIFDAIPNKIHIDFVMNMLIFLSSPGSLNAKKKKLSEQQLEVFCLQIPKYGLRHQQSNNIVLREDYEKLVG